MKRVVEWRIVDHGVDGSQCFSGHSLFGTRFTDCATGVGDTFSEALDDALEQLAGDDWDVAGIDDPEARKSMLGAHEDCDIDDPGHESCELYRHVSVDVRGILGE